MAAVLYLLHPIERLNILTACMQILTIFVLPICREPSGLSPSGESEGDMGKENQTDS